MSLYFQENSVLPMRRAPADTNRLLNKQQVRQGAQIVTSSTRTITRNSKDGKITLNVSDTSGVLGGRRVPHMRTESTGSYGSPSPSGMAALTSPTLDWKDVFRQAETLFFKGEYEQALVWYHRGRRLRPKAREFQAGIAKCERAIENRCAIPATFQFSSLHQQSPVNSDTADSNESPSTRASTRMTSTSGAPTIHTVRSLPTPQVRADASPLAGRRERSFENEDLTGDHERKHLRKLKKDKMYLRDLLREMDNNSNNAEVQSIVEESLRYLDTRSKFWKQQIPLHAIRALQNRQFPFPVNSLAIRDDSALPSVGGGAAGSSATRRETSASNINHYILREAFKVHQDFLDGRYKECISRGDRCLQTMQIHHSIEIARRNDLVASIHGVKGNAFFQMENYKEALRSYYKDLEIAKDGNLPDAKSRALENIGRVYARVGEFDKAVQVWKEKSGLCKTDSERTWLFHEIGYCYLSKREFSRAKQFGEMSYASAEHVGDLVWQLNSTVLIAQAEARMDDLVSAHDTFRYALDLAKLVGDKDEQQNILEALSGLKKAIAEEKEEKRRKTLDNFRPTKKKSPITSLTDEDLWLDDYEGCEQDLPDIEDHKSSSPSYMKGGEKSKRRTRPLHTNKGRQSVDADSMEYGSQGQSSRGHDMGGLSLQGGMVTLRERHNISPIKGLTKNGDFDIIEPPVPPPSPKPKKGILKNTNLPEMYSDLDPDDGHVNTHLLPAIAHSNLQIGNVKPDLSNIVINIPTGDNEGDEDRRQKTVRFKEENETFRLPELAPSFDNFSAEPEPEVPPRLLMRPVLEIDGYFIGKYA